MIIKINSMYVNGTANLKAASRPSEERNNHCSNDEMISCSEKCKEYNHANRNWRYQSLNMPHSIYFYFCSSSNFTLKDISFVELFPA